MQEFYWYDYETTGVSTKVDRVMQFAGVRTDAKFNILDKHMYYCKPTYDCIPSVSAIATTGIDIEKCEAEGLNEYEFFKKINMHFCRPNTCIVGYNNIRFDDEFTRYGFFRNFIDPYAWHFKNNNSRWDILDLVRAAYAFKKDASLNWHYDEDNKPRFKLEFLSVANDIEHSNAHDALADVYATISLAKIIHEKQPKMFAYAFNLRDKNTVKKKIKLFDSMLHTSGMYAAHSACTKMVSAVAYHPVYKDRAIVFNLAEDPRIILENSVADLQHLLFTKEDDLIKDGLSRLDMKEIVFNKSPFFIANTNKLDEKLIKHLKLDLDKCLANLAFLQKHQDKIQNIVAQIYTPTKEKLLIQDVDQSLYDGFIKSYDRGICDHLHTLKAGEILNLPPRFTEQRLNNLFFNFKCRNYADKLSASEKSDWQKILKSRFIDGENGYQTLVNFKNDLATYKQQMPAKNNLWLSLEKYVNSIVY